MYSSHDDDDPDNSAGIDHLRMISDQFILFSSVAVFNIRDAMTDATMSLGGKLLLDRVRIRGRVGVAERQLKAELQSTLKISSSKSPSNARYKAIEKQHARYSEVLILFID